MLGNSNKQGTTNRRPKSLSPMAKYWGVWLPVPTVIAIINTIFWTWLLTSTVGYQDRRLENSLKWIEDLF